MVGCNLIIPGGTRVIDATSMLVMPGNILKKLFKFNSYYLAVNSLYINICIYSIWFTIAFGLWCWSFKLRSYKYQKILRALN